MPRIGQNPAKFSGEIAPRQQVTVAVLSYIPFLRGYYRHSLDVLKLCLDSILINTDMPFDLMVFDNGSCSEVRDYLLELKASGQISFLILSSQNLGKVGAWNAIFGAAPGEYIAYSDGDIFFYPGWLSRHLEIFRAFPNVGTVTGVPRRRRPTFMEDTLKRVHDLDEVAVEIGKFIPEEWIRDHARSLGKLDQVAEDLERDDVRLTSKSGVQAFVTAQHYQFVVPKAALRDVLPFNASKPMGTEVAQFDEAIERNGLLRLAVSDRTVMHVGNTIDAEDIAQIGTVWSGRLAAGAHRLSKARSILDWPPIRRLLLAIYDRIFRTYF
jgi:glycosyltransferase involved in cell wall biosynthesis